MTDAFEDLFHLEADQRGMPELSYFVMPHPIGGVRPAKVKEKAQAAIDDAVAALLGREASR